MMSYGPFRISQPRSAWRESLIPPAREALRIIASMCEDGLVYEKGTSEDIPGREYWGEYWWGNLREVILDRDEKRCRKCNRSGEESTLHLHHILPRYLGGKDNPRNLITLCEECHKDAHSRQCIEKAMCNPAQSHLESWGVI